MQISYDGSGFVDIRRISDNVFFDIRYASDNNFVGERIDGYQAPLAFLTREAAEALKRAADLLKEKNLGLLIFDVYRPKKAVNHFVRWAKDESDTKMKELFYPDIDKSRLFELGFISTESSHSRGSTVDLSLFDLKTKAQADMGGRFDFFGEISHFDCKSVSAKQQENRRLLRSIMTEAGFLPLDTEWWHFTLGNEPYPDMYFDFDVGLDTAVGKICK